jgi:hypothetical protein
MNASSVEDQFATCSCGLSNQHFPFSIQRSILSLSKDAVNAGNAWFDKLTMLTLFAKC